MTDDFSKYPPSISELKSDRVDENSGQVWKPRDALIRMLREIDSGEISPDVLIICFLDTEGNKLSYKQASPSMYTTIGVMEGCKELMTRPAKE